MSAPGGPVAVGKHVASSNAAIERREAKRRMRAEAQAAIYCRRVFNGHLQAKHINRSCYDPHQGERECTRRRRQMGVI